MEKGTKDVAKRDYGILIRTKTDIKRTRYVPNKEPG